MQALFKGPGKRESSEVTKDRTYCRSRHRCPAWWSCSVVCSCAQRLNTAANLETGDLRRIPPRVEVPVSPLRDAATFPALCAWPGAAGGASGDSRGASRGAIGVERPQIPLHPPVQELARCDPRCEEDAAPLPRARAARAHGWAWEAGEQPARGVCARAPPAHPPARAGRLGPGARHEGREGGEKGVGPRDQRGPSGGCGAVAGAERGRLRSWRRQRRQRRRWEKMVALEVGTAGAELYSQAWHQHCH